LLNPTNKKTVIEKEVDGVMKNNVAIPLNISSLFDDGSRPIGKDEGSFIFINNLLCIHVYLVCMFVQKGKH